MARVKRQAKGVRRATASRNRRHKGRAAARSTASAFDRAMSLLPFTDEQLHKIFLFLIFAAVAALAWAVARMAGVPEMAQARLAVAAADAGYEVRQVRITGVERMSESLVYERVLVEKDRPMPTLDLAAVRERLLELPWVRDARVSRQLPETLIVDIVERKPHAVLQKPDRLMLIDRNGNELEPIASDAVGERLRIGGPGAAKQVAALDNLLDAAPALKDRIAHAEWVGNRRWNLTFRTGQMLALPEEEAPAALVRFAQLDGMHRLLGGRVSAVDMRVPGQAGFRCKDGPCVQDLNELGRD